MDSIISSYTEGNSIFPSQNFVPDGYFLNDSIPFNFRLVSPILNDFCEKQFSQIYISNKAYKHPDKKFALNTINTNLLTAYYNDKCLAVSRNANDYKIDAMYGMNHYTYTNIIQPIDWYVKNEFVGYAPGFFDKEKGKGKVSRIWAKPKLIELILEYLTNNPAINCPAKIIQQLKYNSPVVLKSKTGLLNFRPTSETQKMKKNLNEYNEFINAQKIQLPLVINKENKFFISSSSSDCLEHFFINNYFKYNINQTYTIHYSTLLNIIPQPNQYTYINNTIQTPPPPPLLSGNEVKYLYHMELINKQLYRVFNNTFQFGGRCYGAEHQGFSKSNRKSLLINDEPVCELDFSSLHLKMLYHELRIDYIPDPYTEINDNPELRSLYKLISLIIINASSKGYAVRGFNTEVWKDMSKKTNRRFHKELLEKYNLSFSTLYNQFIQTHPKLDGYFFKSVGLKLQRIDSEIAEAILRQCLKLEIPCLPVHDSFIVPLRYQGSLRDIMHESYLKKMKFNIQIK